MQKKATDSHFRRGRRADSTFGRSRRPVGDLPSAEQPSSADVAGGVGGRRVSLTLEPIPVVMKRDEI